MLEPTTGPKYGRTASLPFALLPIFSELTLLSSAPAAVEFVPVNAATRLLIWRGGGESTTG